MFFDLTNSMSMNILVAPELMSASTNKGVLLSMVLRCSGTLVPLQSEVDHQGRSFQRAEVEVVQAQHIQSSVQL